MSACFGVPKSYENARTIVHVFGLVKAFLKDSLHARREH